MRFSHACPLVALAAALAVFAAEPARAQIPAGGASRGYIPPVKQRSVPQQTTTPPPALPGATATYQPAERTAVDLSPNDGLFDAINRGDIAAARDAINHGADLGAHNILGMTPLDLSVDLSRNNITFLLLSLRGSAPVGSHPQGTAAAAGGAQAGAQPPAARSAANAAKPAPKLAAATPRPAPHPAVTVPASGARQFAGAADTGTPVPQAGFLGFGGAVQ